MLGAKLPRAHLQRTDLSGADFSYAHLSGTDLSDSNLQRANLPGANIASSVLIGIQNYDSIKLTEESNFELAICDNVAFIYYISNSTKNIPNHTLFNKGELLL